MRFDQRIRMIYGKELVDILRDHRTLIAMIVVPIVLYPLLMLGSVQAVSYQAAAMEEEVLIVGVVNEAQRGSLLNLIEADRTALEQRRTTLDSESEEAKGLPKPIDPDKLHVEVVGSVEDIDRRVRERSIHIGVVFDRDMLVNAPDMQNHVDLRHDKEDVRSDAAERRLGEMIDRVRDQTNTERKAQARLPATFDEPFVVTATDLSSPPSILGQVLPLILVLMTITGAIYPAIDLTAGERERGTLESLMVCPIPVIDLIVGKFLVVTTVAIMGAALNLGSVTATVYFGGFSKMLASGGGRVPVGTMVFILLSLIPFAVLMSAIMIAVCSFARTFKEAQNYVTPVILAVLIPGGIAALPATRLEGVMLVMPVGNMVLLARDLLLGANVPAAAVVMVLLSTTLYAGAAVAIAASVFGRESVVFCDAASLGSMFQRRLIRPSERPSVSMVLLFVALLFPVWFFIQGALSPGAGEDASALLYAAGWLMPLLFVVAPVGVLAYWKVRVGRSLALRAPAWRYVVAAILIGLSAWAPAYEIDVLQQRLMGVPEALVQSSEAMAATLKAMPLVHVLVVIAVVPAVCEELLFRGFLLGGVGAAVGRWGGIIVSAAVFGVFHFYLFRFVVTTGLGIVMAYLCWQSRSIVPGMIVHVLHNGLGVLSVVRQDWVLRFGLSGESESSDWAHLPPATLVCGVGLFVIGLALARHRSATGVEYAMRAIAET